MKKSILLLCITLHLWATPYNIRDLVSPFDLKDQFGKIHHIDKMPQTLIIAFEKGTGSVVNEYLATQNRKYLEQHNAVFVVDTSTIPNFIIQYFGIPKLQKYSYSVLLSNDGAFTRYFLSQKGKITIIKFKENTINSISFVSSPDELKKAIE